MDVRPKYKRVLLKLSGEALGGQSGKGVDPAVCRQIAGEIQGAHEAGVRFGIVIGGGNIIRGSQVEGIARVAADTAGMMATLVNSLLFREYLVAAGVPAVVYNAFGIDKVAEAFTAERAIRSLESGSAVIVAGGTGNPFFTTDTAAALRCAEMNAEVILKATNVDGVYDSDPHRNPDACRFETISHGEALMRNLRIMDATAFSFCMEYMLPIIVFRLQPGNLRRCIEGERIGTLVTKGV